MRKTLILGLVLGLATCSHPVMARDIKSVAVTQSSTIPYVQPSWPKPADPNQLFYVQRSTNSNTIVYVAQFDGAGNLTKGPVHAYWRRYNTTGEIKQLSLAEFQLAYGLTAHPDSTPNVWTITPKALTKLKAKLVQTAPNKAEVRAEIGGKATRLVYVYVYVDESKTIPRVTKVSISGVELETNKVITETFAVTGAEIRK